MAFLNQRDNVNSLFGTYSIAQNQNTITYDNNDRTNESMYDYILRGKDGLQKKIMDTNKTLQSINEPDTYLTAKRADLNRIAVLLEGEFNTVFQRQLKRNIPLKEVRENTKKEVDLLYDRLMKLHMEDYPPENNQRILKKLLN